MKIKLLTLIFLFLIYISNSQVFSPMAPFVNFGNTNNNIIGVGIGNWPPFGTTNSRFHINNFFCNQPNGPLNGLLFRSDGNQNIINKWQMFSGTAANNTTEKGVLFVSPNSSNGAPYVVPGNNNLPINHFNIQSTEGDIILRAAGNRLNGAAGTAVMNDRMRITAVHFTEPNTVPTNIPFTRIAISSGQNPYYNLIQNTFITNPLAMLHMGDLWAHNVGSHRPWMNYGTFISRQSDGAYFGVRQNEDPAHFSNIDKTDAIIAWGDNPDIGIGDTKYDRLRIIFNSSGDPTAPGGSSGHTNGLECMHFTPIATPGPGASRIVYAGIGDFSVNNPLHPFGDPVRKLEILSDKLTANSNGNPQLRLTNFQQNPSSIASTGKYSEFHSTQIGDLGILTYDNTQTNTAAKILKERFTGINTILPGNSLEINSQFISSATANGQPQAPGFAASTGWAGVRFTDLKSSSVPQINPGQGQLAVDINGDIIYVPTVTANNGIVLNNNIVQLGSNCAGTNAQAKSAQGLQNSRYLHLNGNNFIFGDGGRVGIGMPPFPVGSACAVGNKLEVDNGAANPNTSGLRLTRLTSISPLLPNPGTGYLTVDPNGDVILTTAPTGGAALGGICGTNTNPLVSNWEIPLNNNNFIFSEPAGTNSNAVNNIGIGTSCAPVAKFEVNSKPSNNTTDPIGILSVNNDISQSGAYAYGYMARVTNTNKLNVGYHAENMNGGGNIGFSASMFAPSNGIINTVNMGAQIYVADADVSHGVNAFAEMTSATQPANNEAVAGMFEATGSNNLNVGVAARAGFGPTQQFNPVFPPNSSIGVFAAVSPTNVTNYAVYAIATQAASWAGYFTGNINVNGQGFITSGQWSASDQLFKTQIDTIANPLTIIKQLKPKTYYFDTTNTYGMNFSNKKQYGFIAQDVNAILPELVSTVNKPQDVDTLGNVIHPAVSYKSLNYNAFFALLTSAVQKLEKRVSDQDSIIAAQANQLAALTQSVNSCCSNTSIRTTGITGNSINETNIELSDKDVITLSQNVPNPYAEQTTITYNVPEQYGFAQIIFKTVDGKIIKAVDITKKGKGQLNVFASDLSQGLYMYTLVVDGKVIDTKKMVKQ